MKNLMLVLFFLSMIAPVFSEPLLEQPEPKTKALTVHPVTSIAILGLNVSYEYGVKQSLWALEVPFYFGYNEAINGNGMLFVGTGIGFRRYLFTLGSGTYLEPEVDVMNIHQFPKFDDDMESNGILLAPSLRMGYKLLWENFTMDLGIGGTFFHGVAASGDHQNFTRGSLLTPTFNFALGLPF